MRIVWCTMLFLLLGVGTSEAYECPNGCECVDDTVSCLCENHDSVSFRLMLQLHIKKVLVDGCKQLSLPMAAMLHMDVDSVTFANIDTVSVRPFALSGAERIGLLNITNVANFSVQSQGFSGFINTERIIISNVNVSQAPKGSFGPMYYLQKLIIENSFFGDVGPFGINVVNSSSLLISNTTFKNLANESFAIHNVGEVQFKNVHFKKTMEDSITFHDVDKIEFVNCEFDKLESRSVYGHNINSLEFINSTFSNIEAGALINVRVLERFVVYNNQFRQVENGSLWLNTSSTASTMVQDNSFNCDGNISWIWTEEQNDVLLNTSKCISDNKSLSSYVKRSSIDPVHDNMIQGDEVVVVHEVSKAQASTMTTSVALIASAVLFCSIRIK